MKANLYGQALSLLKELIGTPSFSKQEENTAVILERFFQDQAVPVERKGNNLCAKNKHFKAGRPAILLNSHHDTVLPNKGYTKDPFSAEEGDGKLYGLGSNDAGGCLVALIAAFLHFYDRNDLSYNIIFVASAEEEISGANGIESVLPGLEHIEFGIVGEPTNLEMAVAERGLMVVDCIATGRAGHAARNEGENALYKALDDIAWLRSYQFDRVSPLLGESRITATAIDTENRQHNVVPGQCRFVLDARINELYSFSEVLGILGDHLKSEFHPRSTRLRSTAIPLDHPLVQAGLALGKGYYGSPTTSDKALMPFVTLKMGPGDSARSHTADEFIYLSEIEDGIRTYIQLLEKVLG